MTRIFALFACALACGGSGFTTAPGSNDATSEASAQAPEASAPEVSTPPARRP